MIYIYQYLISSIPDFVIIFWVLKKRIWKEGFKISRFKRSKFHRVFPKVWIVWKKICMNLAIQMKMIDTFSTA